MAELSTYAQNFGRFVSYDGYEFFPFEDDLWTLSRFTELRVTALTFVADPLNAELRFVLACIARQYSGAYTSNINRACRHFFEFLAKERGVKVSSFSVEDVLRYRAVLPLSRSWYLDQLRSALNLWQKFAPEGLDADIITTLNAMRLKGNPKGVAIRTRSPTSGALTDYELQALIDGTIDAYADGRISLQQFFSFGATTEHRQAPAANRRYEARRPIEHSRWEGRWPKPHHPNTAPKATGRKLAIRFPYIRM